MHSCAIKIVYKTKVKDIRIVIKHKHIPYNIHFKSFEETINLTFMILGSR